MSMRSGEEIVGAMAATGVIHRWGTFYCQVGVLQLVLGYQGSPCPLISVP